MKETGRHESDYLPFPPTVAALHSSQLLPAWTEGLCSSLGPMSSVSQSPSCRSWLGSPCRGLGARGRVLSLLPFSSIVAAGAGRFCWGKYFGHTNSVSEASCSFSWKLLPYIDLCEHENEGSQFLNFSLIGQIFFFYPHLRTCLLIWERGKEGEKH